VELPEQAERPQHHSGLRAFVSPTGGEGRTLLRSCERGDPSRLAVSHSRVRASFYVHQSHYIAADSSNVARCTAKRSR